METEKQRAARLQRQREYQARAKAKDPAGYTARCAEAHRRYRKRNPEKAKAMMESWRRRNPNYQVEWRAKNKERHQRSQRESKYKTSQRRPCPEHCECCGIQMKNTPKGPQFDHCHEHLFHRGWLCNSCNNGIARLGDTLEGVLKAVAYLERAEDARCLA